MPTDTSDELNLFPGENALGLNSYAPPQLLFLAYTAPLVKTGETVALLGDSITQRGAAIPSGYVRLVESGLAADGIKIEVIGAGISGNKSNDMLGRVDGQVLSKKPQWMTLSSGVNDVWHSSSGRGVSLEDYKKNIAKILSKAEQAGTKVIILTSTRINEDPNNSLNKMAVDYNNYLRELAKEKNLPLADLSADMVKEQGDLFASGSKKRLTGDGVHMNYLGNMMMARGVPRAFGLNDEQLATAVKAWQTIPNAVILTAKPRLTIQEAAALEAAAEAQNKSLDAYVTDLATEAGKAGLIAPKAP